MGLVILILSAVLLIWLFAAAALVHSLGHPRRKTYAVALGQGDPTDPADLELVGEEVAFTFTDNTRTPGWVIEGEKPDGPTILLVHGFSDSRYGLLRRTPMLLSYASKVVVFDLPGQGEAESERSFGGLREPDDVLAVLRQLEPGDAQSIVLLGISMGAGIAIAAAAKAQGDLRQRIKGVIAEGPYRYWHQPLYNIFQRNKYPRFPIIPMAGLWLRLTAEGFKDFDRAEFAAKLGCPLLVLHGSEDRTCPINAAGQIADAAGDATFIEIEGGRHNDLPFEHEPVYRAAVGDFMEKLCRNGESGKISGLAGDGREPGRNGPAR